MDHRLGVDEGVELFLDLGLRVWGLGVSVQGLGFRTEALGFRVWGWRV